MIVVLFSSRGWEIVCSLLSPGAQKEREEGATASFMTTMMLQRAFVDGSACLATHNYPNMQPSLSLPYESRRRDNYPQYLGNGEPL